MPTEEAPPLALSRRAASSARRCASDFCLIFILTGSFAGLLALLLVRFSHCRFSLLVISIEKLAQPPERADRRFRFDEAAAP